jgi:hypothetical protein
MTRTACIVAVLALLVASKAWGARRDGLTQPMRREVARVGAALAVAPYLMPISTETRFVGVPFVINRDGGIELGAPHAVWGTDPEVERHRAVRLTRAPQFWVVVLDEGGHVAYWTPLTGSRAVRVETPAADDDSRIAAAAFRVEESHGIVRVPFVAGGTVCAIAGTPGRSPAGAVSRALGRDLP